MSRVLRRVAFLGTTLALALLLTLGCRQPPAKEPGADTEALDPALTVVARHPIAEGAGSVAVSPSGALLAYGNAGSGIQVINVPMGVKVHTFPPRAEERAYGYPFAFSGDNGLFVIGDHRRVSAFNVENWALVSSVAFRTPEVYGGPGLTAYPRSRDFLLSDGESLFRWTPGTLNPVRLLNGRSAAGSFRLFPDARRVVSHDLPTNTRYEIWIHELQRRSEPFLLEGGRFDWRSTDRQGPVLPLPRQPEVSPAGTVLACPGGRGIFVWDLANGGKRREILVAGGLDDVAFLTGGSHLAGYLWSRLTLIRVADGRVWATSNLSGNIQAITPFLSEPKLAVMTQKELLIVAIDLAALDKKTKP